MISLVTVLTLGVAVKSYKLLVGINTVVIALARVLILTVKASVAVYIYQVI